MFEQSANNLHNYGGASSHHSQIRNPSVPPPHHPSQFHSHSYPSGAPPHTQQHYHTSSSPSRYDQSTGPSSSSSLPHPPPIPSHSSIQYGPPQSYQAHLSSPSPHPIPTRHTIPNPASYFDEQEPADLASWIEWTEPHGGADFSRYNRLLEPGSQEDKRVMSGAIKVIQAVLDLECKDVETVEQIMAQYPAVYAKMLALAEGRPITAQGESLHPRLINSIGYCYGRWKAVAVAKYVMNYRRKQRGKKLKAKRKRETDEIENEEPPFPKEEKKLRQSPSTASSKSQDKGESEISSIVDNGANLSVLRKLQDPLVDENEFEDFGDFQSPPPSVPAAVLGQDVKLTYELVSEMRMTFDRCLPVCKADIDSILKHSEHLPWDSGLPTASPLGKLTKAVREFISDPFSHGVKNVGSNYGDTCFEKSSSTTGFRDFLAWISDSQLGAVDVFRFLIVLLDLLVEGVHHNAKLKTFDQAKLEETFGEEDLSSMEVGDPTSSSGPTQLLRRKVETLVQDLNGVLSSLVKKNPITARSHDLLLKPAPAPAPLPPVVAAQVSEPREELTLALFRTLTPVAREKYRIAPLVSLALRMVPLESASIGVTTALEIDEKALKKLKKVGIVAHIAKYMDQASD